MKTTYTLKAPELLPTMDPVEGTWDSPIPSSDDRDFCTIQDELEATIGAAAGFPVKVELFDERGHIITDEMPGEGRMLVTRKEKMRELGYRPENYGQPL